MHELTNDELLRYSRHIILPEIGISGQRALRNARILIVGLGGLGSPAALYLAAAGIGHVGLVDFDVVEYSNIQRQIIHGEKDVHRLKIHSAADKLKNVNSRISLSLYEMKLTSENALHLFGEYDVVIDGTDNFPARYLINDASVISGKPYIYGSIYQFEGQASVFGYPGGPCYRCLFPEPPPPGEVPTCAEGGVLGVLPGIIGTLQAVEAIKIIIRKGDVLSGRLLYFDALRMSFREIKFGKNARCPVCGDHPSIRRLVDYENFCGMSRKDENEEEYITPEELNNLIQTGADFILLDVREPEEHAICRIQGALLAPMNTIPGSIDTIDRRKDIILYCHHGVRSKYVLDYLKQSGFVSVRHLEGGIDSWAQKIDPLMPKY